MKRLIAITIAAVLLAVGTASADGRGKHWKHDNRRSNVAVHAAWGPRDVQVVRGYYYPQYRYRRLPPGLAKKYYRTGWLPPGWQKKMQPIPVVVERRLPPLPRGYYRGVIDANAVIYDSRGMIVDVAVLF